MPNYVGVRVVLGGGMLSELGLVYVNVRCMVFGVQCVCCACSVWCVCVWVCCVLCLVCVSVCVLCMVCVVLGVCKCVCVVYGVCCVWCM